ncbi:MAG: metallophosphoesterase family protein [Bacteroidales bacterium]|nr:metallophosphoesterase family protein [Bacteroidales bacterium]
MKRIGILSDTHGFIHPGVSDFFKDCDEIWHAGDIGNIETSDQLSELKPIRAVYGNIDDSKIRTTHPEYNLFNCEKIKVLMIHIGGYPGRYSQKARQLIELHQPQLFISGHSHILKVMPDKKYKLLHINPGSAGKSGLHKKITLVRLTIDGDRMKDLDVFEAARH